MSSWILRISENLLWVHSAVALVWWKNEFFSSFQIELVAVMGKNKKRGRGEVGTCFLTFQIQLISSAFSFAM